MRELGLRIGGRIAALCVATALTACGSTTDTVGRGDPKSDTSVSATPEHLMPLVDQNQYQYPIPFRDVLGKTDDDMDTLFDQVFTRLFYGKPDLADGEAIYWDSAMSRPPNEAIADDEAVIQDILHDEARTEGLGLGMLITVETDHRAEFDKLWRFAKRNRRYDAGPEQSYFFSRCDTSTPETIQCDDPYGLQQFAMSLIFAHDRWGSDGDIDYEADALDILHVMRNKEAMNGGIVQKITNTFDAETQLVFDIPNTDHAAITRPSVLMPAYYELWFKATGDPFWEEAAVAARDFFSAVADTKTGLMPLRAYFDGNVVNGSATFSPESYRVMLNLVLDEIWLRGENTSGAVQECERVLQFFAGIDEKDWATSYSLDGKVVVANYEVSLPVVLGITAAIANSNRVTARKQFIENVWSLPEQPMPENRYYTGILQLFALLVLSGRMQVL